MGEVTGLVVMKRSHSSISVFLSYSHTDGFAAHTLAERLSEIGYHPWVDFSGIVGGTEWRNSIAAALKESSAFLVLLSPDSRESEWVHTEIEMAKANHCPIIPLMIRKCDPPAELESIQFIDFTRDIDSSFNDLQRALLFAIMTKRDTDDIPVTQPPPAAEEAHPAESPTDGGKPTALVIEDVAYYADFLRDVLEESGLAVDTARTRNEAISRIRDRTYSFITLDMQLGPHDELNQEELGQDGLYMLSRLKRYQPQTPVVIVSSLQWDAENDSRIANREQVKGILRKPLDEKAQDRLAELIEKYALRS